MRINANSSYNNGHKYEQIRTITSKRLELNKGITKDGNVDSLLINEFILVIPYL